MVILNLILDTKLPKENTIVISKQLFCAPPLPFVFYQFCQTIVLHVSIKHAISYSQRVGKIFMKCIFNDLSFTWVERRQQIDYTLDSILCSYVMFDLYNTQIF